MKSLINIFLLALLISCKDQEKTGVCTACCDASGNKICKGSVTEKMCADYNKNLVDGHSWTFSEGLSQCPPTPPTP